jgi:hypothetical protein
VGIFQCNPIQSAISQNLIGQNFATELEYIGKCPQCYHSEIHAAAIHDVDVAPPLITADLLRLLHTNYMGHDRVDEALGELGDRSLIAKVNHYCRLEKRHCSFQESITHIEDQLFTTDVERCMCVSRLEAARALVRIQGEMQQNQQAFRLSPWSLERGRLP